VQWEVNGTLIARNASLAINDSQVTIPHYDCSQVQLSITATTPRDAGDYTCLVINGVGNSSDTVSVIVQGVFCWCIVLTLVNNFSYYQLRVLEKAICTVNQIVFPFPVLLLADSLLLCST